MNNKQDKQVEYIVCYLVLSAKIKNRARRGVGKCVGVECDCRVGSRERPPEKGALGEHLEEVRVGVSGILGEVVSAEPEVQLVLGA